MTMYSTSTGNPSNASPDQVRAETDLFIAGGGLAGLSLSIQLARSGYRVTLAEKEQYPFHRVCGEYVSMEAWPFLESLGLPLRDMELPRITELTVTAPNGRALHQRLPLGGFGISRHLLDLRLAGIARDLGVQLLEGTRVLDIRSNETGFDVDTTAGPFRARLAIGSYGKRSNLDLHWKRPFVQRKSGPLENYIGVKYHIDYAFPKDRIALHNFADGYAGVSAIEAGKYCFCYLTTAANLRRAGGSLKTMEQDLLARNPHLGRLLREARFHWPEPVTISNISFARKELVHDHVLFCGDAAGMITPLCGNGMSMALHGSKILAAAATDYLDGRSSQQTLEARYTRAWEQSFGTRLRVGRWIQSLFGRPVATNLFIAAMTPFPGLVRTLVRQTHGREF